jgi:hypothetical protein
MNPDVLSFVNTVAFILDKVGSWPIGTVALVVVLGPWLLMFFLNRGQEKRFEAVREMYENNAELVRSYQKMADNQQDLILLAAQAMQEMRDTAGNNLWCPLVRRSIKNEEIDDEPIPQAQGHGG